MLCWLRAPCWPLPAKSACWHPIRPKPTVHLGLPAKVHETYFPQLFPTHHITGTI